MPLFSVDIEEEIGKHPLAQSYWTKCWTDILVVSMAEHNGNYSASLKNVFDWCTRISGKVFQKSMLLMASSQGLKVVQA
jgi:NAD(P)H-dependent FMN reductase